LNSVSTDVLYGPKFTKWPFAMDYWGGGTYLLSAGTTYMKGSPWWETHWTNARLTSLVQQGIGEADPNKRKEIAAAMQQIEYNEGPYILPIFAPCIDAHASSMHGLKPAATAFSFDLYDYRGAWID
jgi:ABC-type transport system substrate-binding protein